MSRRIETFLHVFLLLPAVTSCGSVLEEGAPRADATARSDAGGTDAAADRTLCRAPKDCPDASAAVRDADGSPADGAHPTWPDGALPLYTDGGCPRGQMGCDCFNYMSCSGTLTCQDEFTCLFTASTTLAQEPEASITFVAADATYVYWCAFDGVKRVPKMGGAPSTLASEAAPDGGSLNCPGLVLDDTSVYWANASELTGAMFSVSKEGGTVQTLATELVPPTALYLVGGKLYWPTASSFWTGIFSGSVMSMPTDGSTTPAIVPGPTNVGCMAAESDALYWYEQNYAGTSAIGVSPLSGGVGVTLLSLPDSTDCFGLAAYGSEVFASLDVGTIGISTATGQNAVLDLAGGSAPLAADGSGVYEIEEGTVAVWRPGQSRVFDLYTAGDESSAGIALDAQFVYWATEGGTLIKSSKW